MQLDIVLLGRVVERIIVVTFGGLSVYWGWRLFLAGVASTSDAVFEKGDWKVLFKKAGAGVYFAFFGSLVLIGSWWSPLQLSGAGVSTSVRPSGPLSASTSSVANNGTNLYYLDAGSPGDDTRKRFRALNTAIDLAKATDGSSKRGLMGDLAQAAPELEQLRARLLEGTFGMDEVETWNKFGQRYVSNQAAVPADVRPLLAKLKIFAFDNYASENK
ncbi:hypothetical protein [Burkholderia stagnalis]|uniref:hypothetical protein n=1 Tax=Burkholderia stagnalis TaxID=1503054 RepID=UPI000A82D60B|nr:hypothetical protein [Burkholderia stagnalis]